MSTKKFFIMFFSVLIIVCGAVPLLNVLVDPFGVFGDRIFKWDSYNFTQNPRTAKIGYIDRHKDEFNSYIIGSSGSSAILVDTLNKYSGDRYYNAFYYGSDLLDSYDTIKYLIETAEVENIFLGLNYNTAMAFDVGEDAINHRMHGKVIDADFLDFYSSYLLANPRYAMDKVKAARQDSFFQKSFDVFIAETGEYDKSIRDTENIGNYDEYVNRDAYKSFQAYPKTDKRLWQLELFAEYMKKIKDLCDENEITLQVAVLPVYWEDFENFHVNEVESFYRRLSEAVNFWDFSKSTISTDPRYFYDSTHFRNSVGDMILAKMYGDDRIYMPEDFGHYVTGETIDTFIDGFKSYELKPDDKAYTVEVPILMLHDIDETGLYSVSEEQFERQMRLIKDHGFNTVSFEELYEYTLRGRELPENPIVITFDDGYQSNYDAAYPILKDLNMKATIYAIGSSMGKDTYKDTGHPIFPHFGYDEAIEMYRSGLIDIQSHTYDMHQSEELEENTPVRITVERFEGESEEDYINAFISDFMKGNDVIKKATSKDIHSFSYPRGRYSTETEVLLHSMNVTSTVTIESGVNTVIKGLPQSLYALKRISVYRDMPDDELLQLCVGET